ncbi:predicted protein [Chaetoceros tenuissimus]|uniref:Uncharacterized protein n=1 Tax=Chaetoceros tenuissimus TaxID=426638 RepID=A0AAD3CV22_9STRA|nr:predicted protein [Chaetoceros tenuissimus]
MSENTNTSDEKSDLTEKLLESKGDGLFDSAPSVEKSSESTEKSNTKEISSKAKTQNDRKSLPKMCLDECHRFHTNPAISGPNSPYKKVGKSNTDQTGVSDKTSNETMKDTENGNDALEDETSSAQGTPVSNKTQKRRQRLISKVSAQANHTTSSPGLTCLNAWAPNVNLNKNAELLAIASPISRSNIPFPINNLAPSNGSNDVSTNQSNHAMGSHVYILVFDEGTFTHCSEFNAHDEVCELFGLPTDRMIWNKDSHLDDKEKCGLRRKVFSPNLTDDDSPMAKKVENSSHSISSEMERSADDDGQKQKLPSKLRSTMKDAKTKVLKPLTRHILDEMKNCFRIFRYELLDDARLLGKRRNVSKRQDEYGDSTDSNPSVIRPQIVFHIKLPYSNTAMEVTSLDWNNDGTTLAITQRKKSGATGSFGSSSSGLTNKKKKSSVNVSVTNTAISYWSIPDWLHAVPDDMKMNLDGVDIRPNDNDGLMLKGAKNALDDAVGWEVSASDENDSLFPLWEWYLSKYIFQDEDSSTSALSSSRTRIHVKNSMEYEAVPMELSIPTSTSSATSSSRIGKKVVRGNRTSSGTSDGANSLINGDISCIFWEKSPLCKNEDWDYEDEDVRQSIVNSKPSSEKSDKKIELIPGSKWVAIGTSKGQIILHNYAASLLSCQSKKSSRKSSSDNTLKGLGPSSIDSQARTVIVPLRYKKRIICGTWVDNLLVFCHVSTGCLTVVSTFSKGSGTNLSSSSKSDYFLEKSYRVVGNIPLPGGKDALDIQMGSIEDDVGVMTILSVNCEGKTLIFKTFPKVMDAANITDDDISNITSSPSMEISFTASLTSSSRDPSVSHSLSKKSVLTCGRIIFHYLIPNTLLALVALSSGQLLLVDWINGLILSDEDLNCHTHNSTSMSRENADDYLLDITYHPETSTLGCLTKDGNVILYHIRILDGCHDVKVGDCTCSTGIDIVTKTHTRAKSSTSALADCDSSTKRLMGTIDLISSTSISHVPTILTDTMKALTLSFSADGECISVSLGDESVVVLSINASDEENDDLKQKLAQTIYQGRNTLVMLGVALFCAVLIFYSGNSEEIMQLYDSMFFYI